MKLIDFLRSASKRERAQVAEVCSDSVGYLYQLAGGHRFASPRMALRIEHQTRYVAAASNGRLRMVPRESLIRHPEFFERAAMPPTSKARSPGENGCNPTP